MTGASIFTVVATMGGLAMDAHTMDWAPPVPGPGPCWLEGGALSKEYLLGRSDGAETVGATEQ